MNKVSVVIDRAVSTVWARLTSCDDWERWWGGALADVVPDWQKGGRLVWAQGGASTIIGFERERYFETEGSWFDTRFSVSPIGRSGSLVEIEDSPPKRGASFSDGGAAQRRSNQESLEKLKALVESRPDDGAVNDEAAGAGAAGTADAEARAEYEGVIRDKLQEHLERMCAFLQDRPEYRDVPALAEQLLTGDVFEFALRSIAEKLPESFKERAILSASKTFDDWIIAVSVCPWLEPAEISSHLPEGYMALLAKLTTYEDNYRQGKHGAHWIFCTDGSRIGVHLSLVPNPNVKTLRAQPVIAVDLLTGAEKRQYGLA